MQMVVKMEILQGHSNMFEMLDLSQMRIIITALLKVSHTNVKIK